MKLLLGKSMLKAIDVIIEQDTTAIQTRYPHQPFKGGYGIRSKALS